jgi:hypothetical protein
MSNKITLSAQTAQSVIIGLGLPEADELTRLKAQTFIQLDRSGGLMRLYDLDFKAYSEKFKERFGIEPNPHKGEKTTIKLSDAATAKAAAAAEVEQWVNNMNDIEEVLKFAIQVGKIKEEEKFYYLSAAVKDKKADLVKKIVLSAPIKPENLKGRYHPYLIKLACMTWDEITKLHGGTRGLNMSSPELYRAKYYEKHGHMPLV